MLGKTKTKLGRIGIEGIVVGIVLCMLVGMIPAQAAQAEGTETIDDVQYTIYGAVYGIDGITPAEDVFVMATNTTGYGNYTYTDKNGSYNIVLNWTYNIGDLVNVTAVNGIRMGNTSFTVTSNDNVEVNIVLQTMPEWWPSDPIQGLNMSSENNNTNNVSVPPVASIEGSMHFYDDVVINPNETIVYRDDVINLHNCNLTIMPGGKLVLRNITLLMWSDVEGVYGINVLSNKTEFGTNMGVLELKENSDVMVPNASSNRYYFNVKGNLLVDGSVVRWMSNDGIHVTGGGVCTVQNSSWVGEGRAHNIYLDAGTLTLQDSTVSTAGMDGVYAVNCSRINILDNSAVEGNGNTGIFCADSVLQINSNSSISNNSAYGVYIYGSSPSIMDNVISNNDVGVSCNFASPIIANNEISNNRVGVDVRFSSPTISNNTILSNSDYGVYSYFSSFTMRDNNISGGERLSGMERIGIKIGICMYYSPLNILDNTIQCNRIGVYVNNSSPTIQGNGIVFNSGSGVYCEYSTDVMITDNNVSDNYPARILGVAEGYGVYVKKSSLVIENNNISGNGRAGIYYADSDDTSSIIRGNTINNHYTIVSGKVLGEQFSVGTGVFCVNASLTISDNVISGNVEGITSVSSSTTISGNDVDSNEGFSQHTFYFPGFGHHGGHWVTITHTIGWGVHTEDSFSTISNNNIDRNHNGILCEYNSYADIVNNNITSNDYGLWFDESSSGDWSITDISVVRDNEIWLNGNLTVYNGGSIALQTTASRSQCYFMLNPKQDGMYQIEVLNGGTLTADNFGFYSATDYHYLFKVRNSADLTLTGWSGIGYCGYNSTSPENMGLFIESNNVLIENCWFQENYCGIVLSGVDIDIVNTTFDYNTLDLYLRGASVAECLNITFDENKVCFEDGVSILNVSWYLHVETTDETATPIENAQVEIYDKNSNLVFIGFTGTDGTIKNIPIQEYAKSSSGKVVFTPHRVEVVKTGVGSAEVYVNVTSSQVVSLILVNTPPELSLGQVLPTSGYTGIGINATTFTYTVTYTDVENDAPDICVYIDNVSYNMSKDASDEDYTDGCIYVFTTILSHKNHTYYFEAMDWKDITTTPIFYGPEIINRPPYWVITTPPLTATAEYFYIYMAQAEDLDNDVLTYSLSVAPLGMSVNSTTGLVTWLPTKEQTGSNNVTLVADDGYGSIISQEFVVTVYLNYPPVLLKRLPLVTFDEDTTLRNAFNLTEYFVDINPEDIITYSCYGTMNVNVTINPNGTVDFSVKENWCGTETITFRATDPSGGYAECKVDITVSSVNDPPIVDAGLNQTVIANETYGSVRLTGTGYDPDGSIVLYEWNFGDGTPTWSSCYTGTTTHIYGTPGNYTATLKVTDNDGDTATDICTIYALEMGWDLPVANATIWNATAGAYNLKYNVTLVGETVNVSAWSSYDRGWYDPDTGESDPCGGAIVCYDWNWRDLSAHSGGCNTSHIYNKGQEYEIVLTVYDNQNFTATDTCIVLVVYRPTADAGPNKEVKMDTPVTLYGRGYFEDEPHGTIVNYIWEFGDGSYGFGASVTHSYTLADGEDEHNYTANLTVTDNYGFTGRDSCIIHVVRNYLPIADAGPDQEVSTYGADSVSVSLNGRGYDSDGWIEYYMWQFSDGTTYPLSTDGSITHTFYLDGKNEKTFTAWLTVTDNQGGHAQDKCIIRVVRNFLPEVYISPNYKATFGNKSVNFTAYAYDRDGSITNYAWQQDGADKVDYSNFPTGISCHYSKPGEIKKYIVKVTVTDNTGATATATATVKVYPNWKPIVFAGQNLASYVTNSEDSRNISFLFMCVDVDGDLKKLNVTFGDGESDETLDVVELTDAQKEAFAKQLQSITVDLSDPSENPLYGMLEDMMWMYDQGMLMIMEAGLMAIGFQAGPMSLMVDICSDVIMGILKGDYQKMLLGIATSIGTETASELAAKCLDLGEVFEAAGVFSLFMDASNIFNEAYERGREHSVANFMAWAYHDLSVKWGLEKSEPLITKEELMDRIVGYTVSHVYAPGGYPVTYPVTVSVTDDDNAEGEGTCDVFLFNNVYPFALTDKEIYGRVNENVTFHAYALDYERDINSWEWDFDNDGVFEWNSLSEMWVQGTSGPSYDMPNNLFGMYGVIGPMANHTYNTTGVHYATLRVTDSGGLNTTIPCKIMVYPLAEAGPDVSRKVNKNVSFSGTGWALNTEIQEYKWDCDGDGDFEHLQRNYKEHSLMYSLSTFSKLKSQNQYVFEGWFNVTDSFTLPGDWAATFKVIDQKNASATDQCRVTIHENRPPIANAGPDQTVKWNSMSVYFDASKSYDPDYGDRIYNYTWNFGDSTTTETTSPTAAHYYNRIGTFTVTLTVWDEDNATGTDSCIVTIMPDAGPDKTVWVGDTVNFYGEGPSNIVTWYWDFRDGNFGSGQSTTHAYFVPGMYEVTLIVTDNLGRTASDTCIITVIDNYIPEVSVGPEIGPEVGVGPHLQTYWGLPLTFYATACDRAYPNGSIVRYSWDFGDGTIVEGDAKQDQFYYYFNYTYTYSWFGEYVVNLTVWDEHGASNWTTCNVTIVNPYGDIFSPVGTVITLIEDTYSYQGTVTFVINVRDDTDRKPYVDVWLDGKWYLKENYTINRTYYNTTVEITINMSTLSLGDHTLKVRAIDLNGNIGYGWINFTVVDDVAPDSQIDVISTYWHNESVIITAAASDERSNITNVTLYYYNSTDNSTWYGPFKFGSDENTPWNWAFDFPNGEGYYRFYTVAWDEAGNQEIFTVNDTACGYDTTAPMSEVIQISPYWQTTSEFTVTANTDDEMSGISTVMLYYQYSYDNATWSNWTLYAANCNAPWQWLFNTSVLDGDGYYQFYSIATDIAGNIEAAPVVADMCCAVDTGMPISSVTPISPYWQTTAGFTMTANASNGMSGISEVELWYRYSVDNVNWSAWAYFATNSTPTFIDGHNYTVSFAFTSPEGDGYYEFYTIAKDTSGNNESAPTKADVACGVDTTLPSSAVTMISPYWQNTIPFAVTVNASDVTSGIKEAGLYYKYSSDNSSWSSWLLFSSNKTTQPYIWDFTAPDGDGYYQFYSIATDNAGNTQETFTTIIICGVDTVAPTTTDNASVGWQNTTVTVTLTPIDSLSGVAYTEYKLWLDGETEPANWNMGTTVMINSDGIWDIKYRSVDNAGNMETNNTVQVQVDMTVPSTSHELSGAVGDNNWFTTNVTVTLIATDMTSGVNCTKYRVDYGDWMMYDGGFELSTEGSHLVEYYSVDNAGNVEKVTNITVKIDKTPPSTGPTITGTTGENNWYISDVTVNLNSIDATSGVNYTEYKLDGSGWQTYTGNFTVNSDGEHVVNYRSVDNAGNVETYKTVSFKIDQTPPIAESILINNDDDYTNTTTVQLSLNAFDNTSGVWMMQFKNELSGTWGNWIPYNTSMSWILQDTEGERTVYFRVKDEAGLISDETSDTILLDKTSPIIVNIITTPSVQEVHGYVNITVTVTDDYAVGTVEIEIIHPNGIITAVLMEQVVGTNTYYYNVSYSLLGWYNFIIRANDLADNFATGEGNFFIGDTTKPEISNIQASPQTQDVFDSVNITCNVTDNVKVKDVYVNITDSQGTVVSVLMENIEGTDVYYYNTTYQINGTYHYSVWAIDTSGNQNISTVCTFNITRRATILIYTGDTDGQYSDNVTLSALLLDTKSNTPIFNRTLSFTFADYNSIGVTDENGTCTVTFMLTQIPNIYPVTVVFSGDEYYLSSAIEVNFTVEKENTMLSTPNVDIVYSDNATLTVTMTDEEGEPILHQTDESKTIHLEYYNGTAWISLGNTTLVNGVATFIISIPEDLDEPAGIYSLMVRFNGDSRYNPANAPTTLTILKENVMISDPSFSIVYSDNATVTITIIDDDNESLLYQEDVEITLEFYHTVWKLKLELVRHGIWPDIWWEVISYWVREGVWTEIDRTTMINGSVTFNVSIPEDFCETAGNYSLRAVFDGNDRYNAASTYGTLTILKENVTLSDPSFTIVYMNSTNITINVTDDDGEELIKYTPPGQFIRIREFRLDLYYFNGTEWRLIDTERLRNGSVTFDIFMPDNLMEMPGIYELMLYFDGNGTYNDAVRYGNLTIIGGYTNLTYTGTSSGCYHEDVLLSAVLTDYFGEGMSNRTITFTIGNQTVNATTNETGVAMATITLLQIPGNYTLTVEFLGDEYYFSSNISVNFTIERKDTILTAYDIVVSDPVNDTLTAMLMEDSTPIAGRNINFYINNTCIGTGVTNETGISTCSIPFIYLFGNFTWTAEFTSDGYYLSSNSSANLSSTHEAKVNGIITMIDKLISDIENSNITDCVASSLVSKLQNVKKKVTQENFNAADNIMNAFQNELDAQHGKELSEEQYQSWYSQSENVRYVLQWMMSC